jgi:hypothetical protein
MKKWPHYNDLAAGYGRHEIGDKGEPTERCLRGMLRRMDLPYSCRPAHDLSQTIHRLRVHDTVAPVLGTIFEEILSLYGSCDNVRAAGLDIIGDAYAFKMAASGTRLSAHAYGAAIDINPAANRLGIKKHALPPEVVAIFKRYGARWGGDWKPLDPGHFEFTKE